MVHIDFNDSPRGRHSLELQSNSKSIANNTLYSRDEFTDAKVTIINVYKQTKIYWVWRDFLFESKGYTFSVGIFWYLEKNTLSQQGIREYTHLKNYK